MGAGRDLRGRYGQWAVVTGATSGIGRAIAEEVAASGMDLVAVARTRSKLEALAAELGERHGVEVRTLSADLSRREGIAAVIEGTRGLEVGLLVPCAAMESRGYFDESDPEREARLLDMDCYGPMALARHFTAAMADRGRGAVLFVSSLSGWMGQPYMAHYGAAKAYVRALGDSLHHELKDKGLHISVLSPGPTDTPMAAETGIDFASMGMAVMQPADVARTGLDALGRRAHAVPGLRNRLMLFMMTRLMPAALAGAMFRWMMGRALGLRTSAAAA